MISFLYPETLAVGFAPGVYFGDGDACVILNDIPSRVRHSACLPAPTLDIATAHRDADIAAANARYQDKLKEIEAYEATVSKIVSFLGEGEPE